MLEPRRARNPPPNHWGSVHTDKRAWSALPPPPLSPPNDPNDAKLAGMKVLQHTLATSSTWRTMEQDFALSLPRGCDTPEDWVQRVKTKTGRQDHIVKAGIVMALNPGCTCTWAANQVGRSEMHQYMVRGIALNARFHPFTRPQLKEQRDKLNNYKRSVYHTREMRAARLDAAQALLSMCGHNAWA